MLKRQEAFWPILKPRQNPAFYSKKETAFRFRGGLVLSYRLFALGVGFGRFDWQWFRIILSLVRVRCWFLTFRLAAASRQ